MRSTLLVAGLIFVASPIRAQTITIDNVTPDDKRFLLTRTIGGATESRTVFVENWLDELKRK